MPATQPDPAEGSHEHGEEEEREDDPEVAIDVHPMSWADPLQGSSVKKKPKLKRSWALKKSTSSLGPTPKKALFNEDDSHDQKGEEDDQASKQEELSGGENDGTFKDSSYGIVGFYTDALVSCNCMNEYPNAPLILSISVCSRILRRWWFLKNSLLQQKA